MKKDDFVQWNSHDFVEHFGVVLEVKRNNDIIVRDWFNDCAKFTVEPIDIIANHGDYIGGHGERATYYAAIAVMTGTAYDFVARECGGMPLASLQEQVDTLRNN